MPYKNPEQKKQNDKKYYEKKKQEKIDTMLSDAESLEADLIDFTVDELTSSGGIKKMLAEEMLRVRREKLNPIQRARTLGYLAGVAWKVVEAEDMEQILREIEEIKANINENKKRGFYNDSETDFE